MTDSLPKSTLIPWPPLIYVAAIAISVVLGLYYPLPWIGDLAGDLLFAAGWVALLAVAALWFTAIRAMTGKNDAQPERRAGSSGYHRSVQRHSQSIYLANTLLLIGLFISGIAWFLPLAFI
jgi:protein-S-isoprenylcysteine O-methyltransferase Ste14